MSKGIYPIDPRVAKAVSLENGELKVNGNSVGGKKLYRHSVVITINGSGGLYYVKTDLISTKSDQYTSVTLPNDVSQIGNHAAFGQTNYPAVTGVVFTLTSLAVNYLTVADSAIKTNDVAFKWTDVLGILDTVTEL